MTVRKLCTVLNSKTPQTTWACACLAGMFFDLLAWTHIATFLLPALLLVAFAFGRPVFGVRTGPLQEQVQTQRSSPNTKFLVLGPVLYLVKIPSTSHVFQKVKVKQRKPHALHKNTKASCFGQNVVHGKPIRKLLERVFPGVLPVSEVTRCLEVWLRVLESGFAFWAAFKSFFVHILQKLVCSMIFNVQTKQNYNVFKRKQNLCPVVSQVNLFQFSGISLSNAQSVFSFLLILPPCLQESDLLSSLF